MKDFKKELSGVADAASKIMGEALKGQQHKIDKNKNNKIDSHDFAILRGEKKAPMKKEEVQQIDELVGKSKLPAIAAYHKQKGAEAKDKMETVRNTNTKLPVPKSTSAKIYAKDAEAKYHSTQAKRADALMKKEEIEQVDEASYSAKAARAGKDIGKPGKMFGKIAASAAKRYGSEERGKKVAGAVLAKLRMKEDLDYDISDELVDLMLEYESKNGVYKHKGTYGGAKGAEYGETEWDKEEKESKKMTEKPAKKKYGARQNYIRSTRVNESFTGILSQYQEGGLKNLFESFKKEEEVLTEEVKEETVEVEVTDLNATNGVAIETIDERTLTEPETAKKEEIVKSMKKKMSGFKERYGDKAKSVMYATATKMAKKGA